MTEEAVAARLEALRSFTLALKRHLPPREGWLLVLFPFGEATPGNLQYASNSQLSQLAELLLGLTQDRVADVDSLEDVTSALTAVRKVQRALVERRGELGGNQRSDAEARALLDILVGGQDAVTEFREALAQKSDDEIAAVLFQVPLPGDPQRLHNLPEALMWEVVDRLRRSAGGPLPVDAPVRAQ